MQTTTTATEGLKTGHSVVTGASITLAFPTEAMAARFSEALDATMRVPAITMADLVAAGVR